MKRRYFLISCFLFLISYSTSAQVNRPKLLVGLVVDQMRWDYLYRYHDMYGADGFKRLLNQGFSCENTMIPYTPPVTGAGHTCIYTGSVPAIHGIVANDWIERETGKRMYCASDSTVRPVGSASLWEGQMSPRNMLTNSIADELRLATNFRSKSIGIALKDRGGIFPAGHSANAAYWFDDRTGQWITSTYYMNELPAWVQRYNDRRIPDSLMRTDWNLLYDRSKYIQSTGDDMPYERLLESDKSRTFPHKYQSVIGSTRYDPFRSSPYGNIYTLDFAKEIIRNEKMGQGGETDMLSISLSSTDYIGHRFGPNSLEVEDLYLRLDKNIADFLNYLDRTLGKNNYLLFLSADHGASQTAGFLKENKYHTAGTLSSDEMAKKMNRFCQEKFGDSMLVKKIYDFQAYLDKKRIESLGLNMKDVKKTLVTYLKSQNEIWNALDEEDLATTILPPVVKEKLMNSYYFRRSGDIQYFYKAQYLEGVTAGTEHGAWYPYDSHIPLVWFGWNVKPGKLNRETYMTDIAPTIAAMLKIQMPSGCIGKVITEVVK
ncbi:MAG: alkaline phosphatase family protein [Ferruginibacter sp.]|nr:alkaline phosphatase family protein [Chitinophagaceae bacterium]MBU9936372.1 alkaline phosphatase family protein [Ferruginibacter sp.]